MSDQPKTLTVGGGLVLRSELGGENGGGALGCSRQRASELVAEPDFPEPAITTVGGQSLWRINDLDRFKAARIARRGRPRKPGRSNGRPSKTEARQ